MAPTPPPGFDWDPTKYARNLAKHKIKFEQAIGAFADPNGLAYRVGFEEGELRHVWLGMISGRVLYLAYTERDNGNVTRVISARRAVKFEVDEYFRR